MTEKSRNRKGSQYFLTIPIVDEENCRQNLLDFVQNFSSEMENQLIEEFCISLEQYEKSENFNFHIHAFFQFKTPFSIDKLKNFLQDKYISNVDCKPCKSKKSLLVYITKHDKSPLTNMSTSKFSFVYRLHEWASKVDKFDITDDFVAEHRQSLSYIKHYFEAFKNKQNYRKKICFKLIECCSEQIWCVKFCLWFNYYISNKNFLGNKLKQMYLWGPSNVGKSNLLIQSLFRRTKYRDLAFYPTSGDFAFNNLDSEKHQIMIFEEYTDGEINMNILKRLLEGLPCSFLRKHKDSITITWKHPIIFTSNYNIGGDDAFKSRFIVLKASNSLFEKKRYPINKIVNDYKALNNLVFENFIAKLNNHIQIVDLEEESSNFIPNDDWYYIKNESECLQNSQSSNINILDSQNLSENPSSSNNLNENEIGQHLDNINHNSLIFNDNVHNDSNLELENEHELVQNSSNSNSNELFSSQKSENSTVIGSKKKKILDDSNLEITELENEHELMQNSSNSSSIVVTQESENSNSSATCSKKKIKLN